MRGPMRANSSQVENLLVTVNSAEHGPDDEVSPRVSRGSVIVKKGYGTDTPACALWRASLFLGSSAHSQRVTQINGGARREKHEADGTLRVYGCTKVVFHLFTLSQLKVHTLSFLQLCIRCMPYP